MMMMMGDNIIMTISLLGWICTAGWWMVVLLLTVWVGGFVDNNIASERSEEGASFHNP